MLGPLLREQQVKQSNTRDNEHSVFHWGNYKWRKPGNFLRDIISTNGKTQNSKMHSRQQ